MSYGNRVRLTEASKPVIKALIILLIIAAGLILGPMWTSGQGLLVLITPSHTIEMSLFVAVGMLLVLLLLLWLLEATLRFVSKGKRGSVGWFRGRKRRKAQQRFNQALHAWLVKNYEEAAVLAEKAAPGLAQPEDAYLLAASAWQALHNHAEQKRLLQLAKKTESDGLAVQLALLENCKDSSEAMTRGKALLEQEPKNPAVLRTVAESWYQHGHLQTLRRLLPDLEARQAVTRARLAELIRACYRAYFTTAGADSERLRSLWTELAKKQRRSTPIRLAYLDVLMRAGHGAAAAKIAARGIHHEVLTASDLLTYSATDWREVTPLRAETEKQIKAHPDHPNWLLLLAVLALQESDYALAERAAQRAISLKPERLAYRLLADALSASGQKESALTAYRQAAMMK